MQVSAPDAVPAGVIPEASTCIQVADFIRDAALAARNADFALANRLLNEASGLIETDLDLVQNEWQKSQFYDNIVRIHTESMPVEYEDSTTDEIAILLFQNEFNESFDSMDVVPQDSITLAVIACQKRSQYDLPIVCNTRVLKAMHFLKSRRKGPLDKWLERANFYLPVMKKMFTDSGLPADLAYLPLIESGFNPKAYSRARASGIWQFIPSTGDRFGLRRSHWVDERRDPLKATGAAISYLKKLHAQFGHWYLALAAYNCGENGLQRNINAAGTDDFWSLKLPRETMNYVPEFVAALILAKNPDRFGVTVQPSDTYTFDTVGVSDCVDLALIEKGIGLEPEVLKDRNPHLTQWCTPPDVNDVRLYLPLGYKEAFLDFYSSLGADDKLRWVRHKIVRGDNLGSIARRYGMTADALMTTNKLKSNRLRAGNFLLIPVRSWDRAGFASNDGAKKADPLQTPEKNAGESRRASPHAPAAQAGKTHYVVRPGDNLYRISEATGATVKELIAWNNLDSDNPMIRAGQKIICSGSDNIAADLRPAPVRSSKDAMVYRVTKGDNLYSLAALFGVTIDALAQANGIREEDNLRLGMLLKIPVRKKETAQPGAAAVPNRRMIIYEVKRGDTIWDIAQNFGVPVKQLYDSNNIDKSTRLFPGDTLKIPVERM